VKYWKIFLAFFRSGMLGFGGGLSAIPLMKREVVDTFNWMGDDEFADILALANTLPGPINTKMSGYIGWRIGGFWGLISAVTGTVIPTVILMVILLTVLHDYNNKPWVKGMSRAVVPIAGIMLGVLTWDFVKKSKSSMGWLQTSVILLVSFIVIEILGIHPAFMIAVLLCAALLSKKTQKQEKPADEQKQKRVDSL
jgi:chromate transporter